MKDKSEKNKINPKDWEACIRVLEILKDHPEENPDEELFKGLVVRIYKDARKRNRLENKRADFKHDMEQLSKTYIFQRNDERDSEIPVLESGHKSKKKEGKPKEKLKRPRGCYVCKKSYDTLHDFYHQLCPSCGDYNVKKRQTKVDLSGRIAMLTGGRKKIGLEIGLMLLRSGARLIVTTRFPNDALKRYSKEKDYEIWKDKVEFHGLDLRNLPSVQSFVSKMNEELPHMDILINNAAQTVKRPLAFYAHLLEGEENPPLLEWKGREGLPQVADPFFPTGKFDKEGQQVDLRENNSWMTKLAEVNPVEMLEVQLVNSVSPFMLNGGLRPLMEKSPFERKFIVNVSAMEGVFNRTGKTPYHPHTNMAKASLNMMTRTSAQDYAESGIYMTSVDTGWITDENPEPKKQRMRDRGFVPPLDIVDGAARVLDPVFLGILDRKRTPYHGVFLKDYKKSAW